MFEPVVHPFELTDIRFAKERLIRIFAGRERALILDGSADRQLAENLSRYSFFACDPIDELVLQPNLAIPQSTERLVQSTERVMHSVQRAIHSNEVSFGSTEEVAQSNETRLQSTARSLQPRERILPAHAPFQFDSLRALLRKYETRKIEGLPPFQGGVAGVIGYDFNRCLERIPAPRIDDFPVPRLAMFVYDFVLAMDQLVGKGWLICQGWPGRDSTERRSNGRVRLQQVLRWLGEPESDTRENGDVFGSVSVGGSGRKIGVCGNARVQGMAGIGNGEIRSVPDSAMNRIDGRLEMYSNFSRNEYLDAIDRAVEYVRAGDIFQVNLSQRLLVPAATSSPELFLQLRRANPAPFSGYLDLGDTQLISASPERLVSRRGGVLETRPIKGTRLRTGFPEVDLARCQELVESEKDRAENVMIVDLMRNDLSRVCRPNSVLVSQLCGVERFQDVIHLVSVVRGEISEGMDNFDVLCCLFPGGSITGAPKIRAMQIIAELEPTARGFYCGSLGYFGCGGEMDFNILIRSVTAKDGWWQIPVGGGITSDSIPELEYQETWAKAVGMLRAVSRAAGGREGELAAAAAATGGL